jgi:hypothetical protein
MAAAVKGGGAAAARRERHRMGSIIEGSSRPIIGDGRERA